jgi:hypothetical protein
MGARRAHGVAAGLAAQPVLPALLADIGARNRAEGAQGAEGEEEGGAGAASTSGRVEGKHAQLRVLCRSPQQVGAARRAGRPPHSSPRAHHRHLAPAAPHPGPSGTQLPPDPQPSTQPLAPNPNPNPTHSRATHTRHHPPPARPPQVAAAVRLPWLAELVLDFLEVQGLREAVAAVRGAGKRVVVALPRILKPDEQRLLLFYLRLGADALLLRGAGCLQQLVEMGGTGAPLRRARGAPEAGLPPACLQPACLPAARPLACPLARQEPAAALPLRASRPANPAAAAAGAPLPSSASPAAAAASPTASPTTATLPSLEGDFSLNAANVVGADLLLGSGLALVTPTHDLNAAQIGRLAQQLGPRASRLEVILHQHLPIFHTEHCVFCRRAAAPLPLPLPLPLAVAWRSRAAVPLAAAWRGWLRAAALGCA